MVSKTRRWPNLLIWITLALVVGFFAVRVYYRLTDDFRIANMTYEMPHNPDWESPPLAPWQKHQLKKILAQPFHYVGKGAQSYVFVSADKTYVIKFFKFKHLKPSPWVEALPELPYIKEWRQANIARKERLLDSVFSGYKLAYDLHRDQAGLFYIHLNATSDLDLSVTLIDKIGRTHHLELDPIVFVIQENARTTRTVMSEAVGSGELALAKRRIQQIIDLYLTEYEKGIYDRDHGVMHNTGFVGDKPIHLDVGKLTKEPGMKRLEVFRPDLEKIGTKFEIWAKGQSPEVHAEIKTYIEEQFTQIFGERFAFADKQS